MYVVDAIPRTQDYTFDALKLDCGRTLSPVTVAYETYGQLNAAKDNAILLLHALSGSAHAGFVTIRASKAGGTTLLDQERHLTQSGILSSARMSSEGAAGLRDQTVSILRQGARMGLAFRSSRSATWSARRSA